MGLELPVGWVESLFGDGLRYAPEGPEGAWSWAGGYHSDVNIPLLRLDL